MVAHALTISLIVLFFHGTTWKGHIFQGIRKVIKPEGMIYKPIYGCNFCMTPWHGTYLYWIIYGNDWRDWLLTTATATGFAVIWMLLVSIKNAMADLSKERAYTIQYPFGNEAKNKSA